MLEIIKNFFGGIIFTEERIHQIIRQNNLERVVQYCERNNLEFVPAEVARLPKFAKEANRFIEARARKSLSPRQFNRYSRFGPKDISSYVETGGILGYDGKSVFEIGFSPPDERMVRIYAQSPTNPNMYILGESSLLGSKDPICIMTAMNPQMELKNDSKKAETIIHWHTHPYGSGDLSDGDVDFMNGILTHGYDKPTLFVIFTPERNKAVWYQAQSSSNSSNKTT